MSTRDFAAGSPIHPGDMAAIDADGKAHAVPRRHDWEPVAHVHHELWLCKGCGLATGDRAAEGRCPGPVR